MAHKKKKISADLQASPSQCKSTGRNLFGALRVFATDAIVVISMSNWIERMAPFPYPGLVIHPILRCYRGKVHDVRDVTAFTAAEGQKNEQRH